MNPDVDFTFLKEKKAKNKSIRCLKNMNKNRFKLYDSYFGGKNLWLIKPTSYNRGRGIRIFESIEMLLDYLKEYCSGVSEAKILPKQKMAESAVLSVKKVKEKL